MKRWFVAGLCLVGYLASAAVEGAVISRDWKTPGDGLLTYDDVNQREWLDLSQTILSSQVPGNDPSPYITRELRYQYVAGQTAPGGLFEGFTVANAADVVGLAQSAGIDTSIFDPPNASAALTLGQLLSFTFEWPSGYGVATGLLDDPSTNLPVVIRPAAFIDSQPNQAGLGLGIAHFQYPTPPGVLLFRVVPEPTAGILGMLVLGAIAARRRCRG
jgi:MYXO-CTERM domain-containing protein